MNMQSTLRRSGSFLPPINRKVVRRYDLHVMPKGEHRYRKLSDALLGGAVSLDRLVVANGKVLLGRHQIHEPELVRNVIGWSQIADGIHSIGNLTFSPDGMVCAGQIHLTGPDGHTHSFNVLGTQGLTRFKTQYSPADASGDDAAQWTDGPDLEIGVTFSDSLEVGQGPQNYASDVNRVVNVYGCRDGTSGSYSPINFASEALGLAAFGYNSKTSTLQISFQNNVTFAPPQCGCANQTFEFSIPSNPIGSTATIVYSEDGSSFSGDAYDFTGSTKYSFRGTAVSDEAVELSDLPRDFVNVRLVGDAPLSVNDLASQTLPDVQQQSSSLTFDCLLYVMPDDLRTNLTGMAKPTTLSSAITEAITQSQTSDFLNNFYGPTYFGWGFANQDSMKSYFNSSQTTQLQYLASSTLSQQAGFTIVNNVTYSQAAINSSERLGQYYQDGADKWATTLYDYITQADQVNQVKAEVYGANCADTLNRFVSLLSVFDPSGGYAKQYYSAIMGTALFSQTSFTMDPSGDDNADKFADIVPDILQYIINNWITLPADPTKGDLEKQAFAQDLQAAVEEEGSIQAVADNLNKAFTGGTQSSMAARLNKAYNYFVDGDGKELGPSMKKLAKGLAVIGFAAGVYSSITGIANWDNLSDADRATVIGQAMKTFSDLVANSPEIITAFVDGVQTAAGIIQAFYQSWTGSGSILKDLDVDLSDLDLEDAVFNKDAGNAVKEIAENNFEDDGKLLFKLGPTVKGIVKAIGVIGQAVMAGVQIYTFIKDIADGAPISQDIIDGIEAVSSLVVAVCEGVELFVESALAAALGMIFAIVGIVVAIIALFFPAPKKPTPAESYTTGTIIPFVNKQMTLNPVPANWALPDVKSSST